MKRTGKCPKCGCADIIVDAIAIDRGHANSQKEMTVGTFRNPGAMIFKGLQESTVSAWVCTECGFVEFYADDPKKIKLI
jgi:predicted nucleic-acid-binding Zn-ribbon protein